MLNHSHANLDLIRSVRELCPQHWPIQPRLDGSTSNTCREAEVQEERQEIKDENQGTCEIWLLLCTKALQINPSAESSEASSSPLVFPISQVAGFWFLVFFFKLEHLFYPGELDKRLETK